MLIDTKICELLTPDSATNTDAESYEYYLVWLAPDGGVYSWLFEDFEQRQRVSGEIINTKTKNITKYFSGAENVITLTAEDLSENEFDSIVTILRAKMVRRYYKNNTFDELAIVTDSYSKPKSQYRYSFQFDVQKIDSPIW